MPKTLHLTLTYHWWDKVDSGEKNAEYRRFTANWRKRLADIRPLGVLLLSASAIRARVIPANFKKKTKNLPKKCIN